MNKYSKYLPYNFLFFLLVISITRIEAQNTYNFDQFMDEGVDVITQPSRWDTGEWLMAGAISAGTYGLMHLDDQVYHEMLKNRRFEKPLFYMGTLYGEPLVALGIISALALHGKYSPNRANLNLGYDLSQAVFYSTSITILIKYAFGRARPYMNNGAFDFNPFSFKNNSFLSFSSGHTVIAFALSTVLSENSDSDFWKYTAFVPAVLTGFSRVYHVRHWLSDVFMGACLGYFIGKFVAERHELNEINYSNTPPPLFRFTIPLN